MSTTKGVMVTLSPPGHKKSEAGAKLENGKWKMENRNWKMRMGSNDFQSSIHISRFLSYLEAGEWKLENGKCEWAVTTSGLRYTYPASSVTNLQFFFHRANCPAFS
jgi:hypothetical protein